MGNPIIIFSKTILLNKANIQNNTVINNHNFEKDLYIVKLYKI